MPYIKMTLGLLGRIGIESRVDGQNIRVFPRREAAAGTLVVESDWSSASYFYSIVALAEPGTEIKLTSYRPDSLQGDSVLSTIYEDFGVETSFEGNAIALRKIQKEPKPLLSYDLSDAPDLAQTLAVTCFGMGIGCELTGLHTLKIKETDRLLALETELGKLGASLSVSDDSLTLWTGGDKKNGVAINTYNDHRMAMAFAPLALKTSLTINDAGVVSKSYPDFWKDIKSLGFCLKESV
jgi:3-phosphoshikimate 1-carboxyvinyltransferase